MIHPVVVRSQVIVSCGGLGGISKFKTSGRIILLPPLLCWVAHQIRSAQVFWRRWKFYLEAGDALALRRSWVDGLDSQATQIPLFSREKRDSCQEDGAFSLLGPRPTLNVQRAFGVGNLSQYLAVCWK